MRQQRIPVGQRDVAPHHRRRGRDAREVAKAAGREAERIVRLVSLLAHRVHQRVSRQMRQMTDGGEEGVVIPGVHRRHPRSRGAPHRLHQGRCILRRLPGRRQHAPVAGEQVGARGLHARTLAAGDRMRRHEARQTPRIEMPPRRLKRMPLGAAGIGDDGCLARRPRQGPEHGVIRTHRHAHGHHIGARHAFRQRGRRLIHHAQLPRPLQVRRIAADAGDVRHRARLLQRPRERPANEPDANHRQPLDTNRPAVHNASTAPARASRKRAFSAGVPTVTRR